jgi:hypothetical protein
MAGTCKENGSGSDAKEDDGRKTVFIKRRRGRPRLRWMDGWMDDVVADLKVMKIKQWIEKTKDREQWKLVVEEAKALPGL